MSESLGYIEGFEKESSEEELDQLKDIIHREAMEFRQRENLSQAAKDFLGMMLAVGESFRRTEPEEEFDENDPVLRMAERAMAILYITCGEEYLQRLIQIFEVTCVNLLTYKRGYFTADDVKRITGENFILFGDPIQKAIENVKSEIANNENLDSMADEQQKLVGTYKMVLHGLEGLLDV